MKKYTLVSFVLVLTLLVGFKFANATAVVASDSGCNGTEIYSSTTGQLCNTTALQIGSKGAAVKAFQQVLKNAGFLTGKVDGIYGKITSAAATAYYKIHSPVQPTAITPAPIITPISTPTPTPINTTPVSTCTNGYDSGTGFVCGCTSTSGYSATTGNACDGSIPSTVVGCSTTSGYSSVNGNACDGSTPTPAPTYPAGCTSTSGYSSTNGEPCGGTTSAPTVTLTVSPNNVAYGGSSTLTWSSTNATSCTGYGGNIKGWSGQPNLSTSGSIDTGAQGVTTTYEINCLNSYNVYSGAIASTTVTVAPSPFPPGCTSNSGYSSTNGVPCDGSTMSAPTASLTADSTNLSYGNSTILHWSSTNATSCSNVLGKGDVATSGSVSTGVLTQNTTFNITCSNSSYKPANASVTINIAPSPFPPGCTSNSGYSSLDGSSCSQ